jgi:hypothetical protein
LPQQETVVSACQFITTGIPLITVNTDFLLQFYVNVHSTETYDKLKVRRTDLGLF